MKNYKKKKKNSGYLCPEWDSHLGRCKITVFEDCQATMLTTRPPWLVKYCFIRTIYIIKQPMPPKRFNHCLFID